MNLRQAIYGVFAFWFVAVMVLGVAFMLSGGSPVPGHIGMYWMFYCMLVFIAGWIAYLWDVFHNPRVPVDKRALWAVVLAFVGPYAMPFYFWFYIRGEGKPPPPPPLPGTPPSLPGGSPPPLKLADDPVARALLPVGRSGWAIAAGYLGLFSLLVVPAPLAIGASVLALSDMRRHPEKLGMGRTVFGLIMGAIGTVALVALLGFLGFQGRAWPPEPDWGNKRIISTLAQIRPSDVHVATVDLDRCPRQPVPLRPETVTPLLKHLSLLRSARTIGEVGQWDRWRLVVLDCGEKGYFNIFIGSRPSLNGAPIVSIEQGIQNTQGGFYEGTAFWSWLQTVPESAALSGGPQPCK